MKFCARTLTRYSRVADEEKKKEKVFRQINISNFEIYTRYSEVADEKKSLRGRLPF